MASTHDYSELHTLIDKLKPGQLDEVRRHVSQLIQTKPSHVDSDDPSTNVRERTRENQIAEGRIQPAREPKQSAPEPIQIRGLVTDLIAEQRR